jgi:hypothetical protein
MMVHEAVPATDSGQVAMVCSRAFSLGCRLESLGERLTQRFRCFQLCEEAGHEGFLFLFGGVGELGSGTGAIYCLSHTSSPG